MTNVARNVTIDILGVNDFRKMESLLKEFNSSASQRSTVPIPQTGTASSVTYSNRDYLSTNGGQQIACAGTGFSGTPRVWVGGQGHPLNPATGVVVLNGTTIAFNVPAFTDACDKLGTNVDIVIENQTLTPATVKYFPAWSTSYKYHDFEDNTLGPYGTNIVVGTVAASADFAKYGTKSAKCNVTGSFPGGGAALAAVFSGGLPQNAPTVSNGLWGHRWMLVPSATITDLIGATHQMKLELDRVGGGQPPNAWHQCGIGNSFPPSDGTIVDQDDESTGGVFQYGSNVAFGDGVWNELTSFMWRDTVNNLGYMCFWVNGKLVVPMTSHANFGTNLSTNQYDPFFGAVYTQSTGALLAYVDEARWANGAIDGFQGA